MDEYVPGVSPDASIPNDNDPSAAEGRSSQLLPDVLASVMVGVPVLAVRVELLFAVVLFCITEKDSDVGENDNSRGSLTVRLTSNVASVYPLAEAVTVDV